MSYSPVKVVVDADAMRFRQGVELLLGEPREEEARVALRRLVEDRGQVCDGLRARQDRLVEPHAPAPIEIEPNLVGSRHAVDTDSSLRTRKALPVR